MPRSIIKSGHIFYLFSCLSVIVYMSAANNTAWNLPRFGIPKGLLYDTPQNSWADGKSSGIYWVSDWRSLCSSGAHSADCSFPVIPMMLRMRTNLPSRSPPRAGRRISTVPSWRFRLNCSYKEAVRNSCLSERATLRYKVKAPCALQMSDITVGEVEACSWFLDLGIRWTEDH